MMIINEKEKKILWIALNNCQSQGINFIKEINKYPTTDERIKNIVSDWIKQTEEEYNMINDLKVKLCGDVDKQ